MDKIHLKCDCLYGSLVNGVKQSILFTFLLEKPSVYKIFRKRETINFKKLKQICFENYNFLFRR